MSREINKLRNSNFTLLWVGFLSVVGGLSFLYSFQIDITLGVAVLILVFCSAVIIFEITRGTFFIAPIYGFLGVFLFTYGIRTIWMVMSKESILLKEPIYLAIFYWGESEEASILILESCMAYVMGYMFGRYFLELSPHEQKERKTLKQDKVRILIGIIIGGMISAGLINIWVGKVFVFIPSDYKMSPYMNVINYFRVFLGLGIALGVYLFVTIKKGWSRWIYPLTVGAIGIFWSVFEGSRGLMGYILVSGGIAYCLIARPSNKKIFLFGSASLIFIIFILFPMVTSQRSAVEIVGHELSWENAPTVNG